MGDEQVRPFHCGSQFGDWQASNCHRCTKSWANCREEAGGNGPCEIDNALAHSYVGDGEVSRDIAERMGYVGAVETPMKAGDLPQYVWPCPEVEWTPEWVADLARHFALGVGLPPYHFRCRTVVRTAQVSVVALAR